MRLINTSTLLPEEFFGQSPPPYAILSHTWGLEEVSYHDLRVDQDGITKSSTKEGFAKLQQFCQQASADGFQYCWMDTCCIDKSNASELSEAINSHFAWYQGSSVCHVYLKDVKFEDGHITDEPNIKRLEQARWFTRGWTLQELIAPTHVVFFDLGWQRIGTKAGLAFTLQLITGVSQSYLSGGVSQSALALCSVAERMSWAAKRSTTRVEDIAYCLVGLFNVRMSVLYGEGTRAFWRLQREILKGTTDQSLLAWRSPEAHTMPGPSCVFANSPAEFDWAGHKGERTLRRITLILADPGGSVRKHPMSFSNNVLTASMPLVATLSDRLVFAVLNCTIEHMEEYRSKLWLALWRTGRESFHRLSILSGVVDPSHMIANLLVPLDKAKMIYIEESDTAAHSYVQLQNSVIGDRYGILVSLPAGKQSFERATSFPEIDEPELGIFWLCQRDGYHHGTLIFEKKLAGAMTHRVGVFFARNLAPLYVESGWTCRVLPSVGEAASPEDLSESELKRIRFEEQEMSGGTFGNWNPFWRTSDQFGETVVCLDWTSFPVAGGDVALAIIVFHHPQEESQRSLLDMVFRELSVR